MQKEPEWNKLRGKVINKNKQTERARQGITVSEEWWDGGGLGKACRAGAWWMELTLVECLLIAAQVGSEDGSLKSWCSPLRMMQFYTEWSWGSQNRISWVPLVRDHATRKEQNGIEPKCEWFQSSCSFWLKTLAFLRRFANYFPHISPPTWNPVQ